MMDMVVERNGNIRMIYDEAINVRHIGELSVRRVSQVEPVEYGLWIADLSLLNGPILGPFEARSEAIEREIDWLRKHWLLGESSR